MDKALKAAREAKATHRDHFEHDVFYREDRTCGWIMVAEYDEEKDALEKWQHDHRAYIPTSAVRI